MGCDAPYQQHLSRPSYCGGQKRTCAGVWVLACMCACLCACTQERALGASGKHASCRPAAGGQPVVCAVQEVGGCRVNGRKPGLPVCHHALQSSKPLQAQIHPHNSSEPCGLATLYPCSSGPGLEGCHRPPAARLRPPAPNPRSLTVWQSVTRAASVCPTASQTVAAEAKRGHRHHALMRCLRHRPRACARVGLCARHGSSSAIGRFSHEAPRPP